MTWPRTSGCTGWQNYWPGEGVEVICIGRTLPDSPEPEELSFQIERFRMFFQHGPLFYAFFNWRLWGKLLLARKPDLLISNDLDTLPACYLAAKIKGIPLIYDSHEFFTETPELIHRKRGQGNLALDRGLFVAQDQLCSHGK
jgi:hypothetical protein